MTSLTTRATPERLYRLLADNATDVITLLDAEGRHLYISPSVTALAGYDPDDLVGADGWSFLHPDDLPQLQRELQTAAAEGSVVTVEYRIRHADGHYIWVETTARSMGGEIQCSTRDITARRAASAELARRLAQQSAVARLGRMVMERVAVEAVRDEAARVVAETEEAEPDSDFLQSVAHILASADERDRYEQQMRHDALHDALTGLPNRTLLLDRLYQALARAGRDGSRVAVIFLDLDNLKVLNDSLGHQAGDQLLQAIGPRLRRELRAADTVARFGGDEFAVVCSDVTDEHHGAAIAERLVRAFEEPFLVDGEERFGSASVGVVITDPQAPREPEELLSDADAAMYRAKERGRGRAEVFDAGLRARITARLSVERDLRRALDGEGRLWVAYQPYYRLPGRSLAGVEALVRWEHPERGNVPPADFIPVAEESGLIVPLGARVLREACRQVARWRRESGHPGLRLTVNVSARQMASPEFVETVQEVLEETGLHPDSLGLEITEGLLLEETPGTALTIELLQTLGVRLLLDDFGTGYSSLRYLQRYALDGLKVDRAFVAGLGAAGDGDGAIVEAIVGMARALGMGVIPEGVETDGQLERLAALGCDHAQGFLLSRPLPAAELEVLLRGGG
ncbi:MAG TPA: EAL domain-containing protein [Solirubrobacteraceae bacterium]|nr:EAL domain-containing protein [Solirubrobacteraceae bacterium]